jgi:hypothetical protein
MPPLSGGSEAADQKGIVFGERGKRQLGARGACFGQNLGAYANDGAD